MAYIRNEKDASVFTNIIRKCRLEIEQISTHTKRIKIATNTKKNSSEQIHQQTPITHDSFFFLRKSQAHVFNQCLTPGSSHKKILRISDSESSQIFKESARCVHVGVGVWVAFG